MSAKFLIFKRLRLQSRQGVYLVGDVLGSGIVRVGMFAKIWIDGGAYSYERIESVEFVDNLDGRSCIAIEIPLAHPDDAEVIRYLCPEGSELEIVDVAPG